MMMMTTTVMVLMEETLCVAFKRYVYPIVFVCDEGNPFSLSLSLSRLFLNVPLFYIIESVSVKKLMRVVRNKGLASVLSFSLSTLTHIGFSGHVSTPFFCL